MQRAASSTVDILMKPKPLERSDYQYVSDKKTGGLRRSHPLVINDGNFFYATKTAELFVQVALLSTNAQTEYSEDAGGIGRLLVQ